MCVGLKAFIDLGTGKHVSGYGTHCTDVGCRRHPGGGAGGGVSSVRAVMQSTALCLVSAPAACGVVGKLLVTAGQVAGGGGGAGDWPSPLSGQTRVAGRADDGRRMAPTPIVADDVRMRGRGDARTR